jgi:subtilisin-like proprotein convertase family protein
MFTSDDAHLLGKYLGMDAGGTWSLHVADVAPLDVGTLRSWGLEIEVEETPSAAQGHAEPGAAIPDENPNGVTSAIEIGESGGIGEVEVFVDISHTYISDLLVKLVPPTGGQGIVLHDGTGGSTDNLIRRYDSSQVPALAELRGSQARGVWTLIVKDMIRKDVGKLNRWSLQLSLER